MIGGKPGYRFGNTGKIYTYTPGDKDSITKAKKLAEDSAKVSKAYKTTHKETTESIYLDDGTIIRHSESIYIDEPVEFDVMKTKDNQTVFGYANVSVDKEGNYPFEWQDDIIPTEVLEKAAYNYVIKYRGMGEQHIGESVGILIESCMFTKEKMEVMGIPEGTVPEALWVGYYIPDEEVFAKVKDGTYKMFSIQGKAKKLKV